MIYLLLTKRMQTRLDVLAALLHDAEEARSLLFLCQNPCKYITAPYWYGVHYNDRKAPGRLISTLVRLLARG